VDVHPSEPRLATGGADHAVRIWTLPVPGETGSGSGGGGGNASGSDGGTGSGKASDKSGSGNAAATTALAAPRVRLATLQRHASPVNVVRWHPGGWLLASGSDDHSVILWEKVEGHVPSAPFGSSEPADTEAYRAARTFTSHTSDVTDLAFSPDGTQLASCGLDGRVCVYQLGGRGGAHQAMHLAKVIENAHDGYIKGIAWDPIGKYIATQGDDKTVRLFRVLDWEHVATVAAPYAATTDECFVRRLAFSPDGQHLATPHANNGIERTAAVLRRDHWTEVATEFVGHSKPVTVCRYARTLFAKRCVFPPGGGGF
jgi:protein HIRA/HIR1